MRRGARSVMGLLVWMTACSGEGPPLPGWLFEGDTESPSTSGEEPTSVGVVAECGNGQVEEGEDCDGIELGGATCESLGFSEGGLMCAGCGFDASGCERPLGMVEVSGGLFWMGPAELPDGPPMRQVQVDAFWMDETEVTVAAYAACVADGACTEPGSEATCSWMVDGHEDHPVSCVTWKQADDYCGWAGGGTKRLPTEAEWEKAARGTEANEYPWGGSPSPNCTYVVMSAGSGSGCGDHSTWSVGRKDRGDSPYGAHDMAGNVWEWVADWYAESYAPAETDNPTGPATGQLRVARGGSWEDSVNSDFRTAHRRPLMPSSSSTSVGFRCAHTPPDAP